MAYAADELAGDLRAALTPGEPVHWRSTLATARVRGLAIRAVVGLGSMLALAAIWLAPGKPGVGLMLLSAGLFIAAAATVVPLLDKLTHSAVVLCPDRLVCRQGIPFRNPVRSIPRSDVTLAVVYEGENTVVLYGESGELARLTSIASPRDMALMLHVTVHVWIDRKVTKHGNLLARGAIGLAAMVVSTVGPQFVSDMFTRDGFRLRAALVTAVLLAIAGLVYLGGHWWRARSMSAEQRRETACYILDPLWRGRDPYTKGYIPWWEVPVVTARMWLVRHLYGGPYDSRRGIRPLVYQPNSMIPD